MKKAIAGFFLGLACLFLFSITWGNRVISKWEPRPVTENRLEDKSRPGQISQAERESRKKKLRLLLNPFGLAKGLTIQELDDLLLKPGCRYYAFLFLVGSIWMAIILGKPGRHQL